MLYGEIAKKNERALWIFICVLFIVISYWEYHNYADLKNTFLVNEKEPHYEFVLESFSKKQQVNRNQILTDFYLSRVGFSDRTCIRIVPKAALTGGATTYCFTKTLPARLIGEDHEAE